MHSTVLGVVCRELDGTPGLSLERLDRPRPGAGQITIRVVAAGLNFPDLLITRGRYQVKPDLPFVLGMELSGTILEIGDGVHGLSVGDRVSAVVTWGAFSEVACVDAARAVPLPDEIDHRQGAALGLAYQTAWHALKNRAHLRAGERLLVLGAAGGVGLAAVQLGKAVGATVIAAASSDSKLAVCDQQGADHLVNYKTQDLREAITSIAGREGVDVVVDPVGGELTEAALRCLAWRGRHLVIGFAQGQIPSVLLNRVLLSEREVLGVYVGEYFRREPEARQVLSAEIHEYVRKGAFQPLISSSFPLAAYKDALDHLESGAIAGKLILDVLD